jgi:hypothetical protein
MRAVVARLLFLAMGLAAMEIAVGGAPGTTPILVASLLVIGFIGIVAGSAGFMVPLLGHAPKEGSR